MKKVLIYESKIAGKRIANESITNYSFPNLSLSKAIKPLKNPCTMARNKHKTQVISSTTPKNKYTKHRAS